MKKEHKKGEQKPDQNLAKQGHKPQQTQQQWDQERQRLLAEIDNLQKQQQHEMLNYHQFRNQDLIVELLEVVDALHYSLAFKQNNDETKRFLEGIKMTVTRFDKILNNFGVERIKTTIGQKYDPNLHQTLGANWDQKHPEEVILKVEQQGYSLHQRVLRPSKVIINQKPKDDK